MRLASRSFRAIAIVLALAGMPLFAGSAAMVAIQGDSLVIALRGAAGPNRSWARSPGRALRQVRSWAAFRSASYGSTQTTPPAQNPNSLASLWSSTQELAEKLQSSFANSDLTLFALVRMLRGRKLRGLLSEDSVSG
jgi:hypothetical protein